MNTFCLFQTIITPAELCDNLDNPNYLVLDCSGTLKNSEESEERYQSFLEGHIPNARYFCIFEASLAMDENSYSHFNFVIQDLLASGINENTQIILYGNSDHSSINHIWLYLRSVGFKNVAVLSGGIQTWKKLDFPLEGFSVNKLSNERCDSLGKDIPIPLH